MKFFITNELNYLVHKIIVQELSAINCVKISTTYSDLQSLALKIIIERGIDKYTPGKDGYSFYSWVNYWLRYGMKIAVEKSIIA